MSEVCSWTRVSTDPEFYFRKARFVLAQVEETVVAEMFGADIQNFGKLCWRISRENKIKTLQAMMSLEDKITCTVVARSFLWAGQILWAGKAERGEFIDINIYIYGGVNLPYCDITIGYFQNRAFEL